MRAAVDLCHRDGSLKREVAENPAKYIHEVRHLPLTVLADMLGASKHVSNIQAWYEAFCGMQPVQNLQLGGMALACPMPRSVPLQRNGGPYHILWQQDAAPHCGQGSWLLLAYLPHGQRC